MKRHTPPSGGIRVFTRLPWGIAIGGLIVALIFILRPTPRPDANPKSDAGSSADSGRTATPSRRSNRSPHANSADAPARPAEEIVAEKVSQFALSREEIVAAMAKKFDVAIPPEVTQFLAAARSGNWQETTNLFATLQKLRHSEEATPSLEKFWPVIVETYGVAEQAHLWPAQKLLDYGNAVLDSLRPGMIYVGGNDAGRYIPTLLTETSGGEPYIVLTQNGLADGSYLDYVRFRYGEQLAMLTPEDSGNSFKRYIDDATKRLRHDEQFPGEPKQLRPGEYVRESENRISVSGHVAVMAINESLLQMLLEKNPDRTFALEESFPLKSLYAGATTLGPVTELRASDPATALTAERAAQSVDYWRGVTSTLLADANFDGAPRDAYVKQILGQGNLFADRKFAAEAEQAFELATRLNPGHPSAVFAYVNVLTEQKRFAEARQVVQTAANLAPNNQQFQELLSNLQKK